MATDAPDLSPSPLSTLRLGHFPRCLDPVPTAYFSPNLERAKKNCTRSQNVKILPGRGQRDLEPLLSSHKLIIFREHDDLLRYAPHVTHKSNR